MMMSQAQKYLWIIAPNCWGYLIFLRWCAMFSENDHSCRLYYCSILTAQGELEKIAFDKSQGWGVIQESEPN
jgi:hypothetical protein